MNCSNCEFFRAENEWSYCYLHNFHMDSINLLRDLIREGEDNKLKVITPKRRRVPVESRGTHPSWCPLPE